jgi:hypothetical protein
MTLDTTSPIVRYLLGPTAPLEHLHLNIDSSEHHRVHRDELIVELDRYCTQLQHPVQPQEDTGVPALDLDLMDPLRELESSTILFCIANQMCSS